MWIVYQLLHQLCIAGIVSGMTHLDRTGVTQLLTMLFVFVLHVIICLAVWPKNIRNANYINVISNGKYSKRRERASRNGSTVVDISIHPPFFKLVSVSFSRSPLSKSPKQVFFNPIYIFDSFTTLFYYYQFTFFV